MSTSADEVRSFFHGCAQWRPVPLTRSRASSCSWGPCNERGPRKTFGKFWSAYLVPGLHNTRSGLRTPYHLDAFRHAPHRDVAARHLTTSGPQAPRQPPGAPCPARPRGPPWSPPVPAMQPHDTHGFVARVSLNMRVCAVCFAMRVSTHSPRYGQSRPSDVPLRKSPSSSSH